MKPKPRVVVDTNVIVSAVLKINSYPSVIIKYWYNNEITLITSEELLQELIVVLKRPYFTKLITNQELKKIESVFTKYAHFARPSDPSKLNIKSHDINDNIVLTTAIGGKADFIISGDLDLLDLNHLKQTFNFQILTVKQFLDLKHQ